jgi:hypothetical protein
MNYKEIELALHKLQMEALEIAGKWNGDDTKGEEKAHCCMDIDKKAQELLELIEEYKYHAYAN